MELAEDIIHYVQFRDAHKKQLAGFDRQKDRIIFRFKTHEHTYILAASLNKEHREEAKKISPPDKVTLVVQKTPRIIKDLLAAWQELTKNPAIYVLIITETGKTLLHPVTHHKIADPETLQEGLQSLMEKENHSSSPSL